MFEVGKCYKHSNGFSVYKCLAATGDVGWMKADDHVPSTIHWSNQWSEYREPVVVRAVHHISTYGESETEAWKDRETIKDYGETYVGSIEITVTDGKLTDVRIL